MRIAIPSEAPGGLSAPISAHFGHCDVFTLVDVDGTDIRDVRLLPNPGHEHGGCLGPVNLLQGEGVDTLIAGGMGPRPLAGFQQAGITVFFREETTTVQEAVAALVSDGLRQFGEAHTCGGHGGHCGQHDHEEPRVEVVDEPVGDGHIVRFAYELREAGQEALLDASEGRYAHGTGQLLPALERAMAGRRAGETFALPLAAADAFGEPNPDAVVEVDAQSLPATASPGDTLHMRVADGSVVQVRLVSRGPERAVLDANHPLAGRSVEFRVNVLEVAARR